MTDNQKAQIIKLRAAGNGYGKIAQTIGISVKDVYKRQPLRVVC